MGKSYISFVVTFFFFFFSTQDFVLVLPQQKVLHEPTRFFFHSQQLNQHLFMSFCIAVSIPPQTPPPFFKSRVGIDLSFK